ncbi:dienelactone hydrolase family protein [Arsenicicoccus dermatophilus]|uniref:dienelactone hydrolase family protein n=1 Tax=Arsenicicoccus dermatophilus TaxID=1076331 RepID=UPI001F4CBB87|nr:dienelactone hydrolase family protein [Arsenicicoccus dermatophilus]MCH8613382.1 dienelactone hydrolase family protein [Arsenicicoccus dermatophilus]
MTTTARRSSSLVTAVLLAAALGTTAAAPAVADDAHPYQRGPAPTATSAQVDGPFEISKTVIPAASTPRFGGGDLFLPKDTSQGTFGGVVLIPGWSGARSTVAWMAPRLASQGFVVLLIDAKNTLDGTPRRAEALQAGLAWLKDTPLAEGVLDRSRLGVWGYSMGGGGSLRVGESRPDLKAVVNVFPWDSIRSFPATTTPSLVLAAQKDLTAPNSMHSIPMYASLTKADQRAWVELAGAEHLLPLKPDARLSEMTTAWFKRYVDDDTRYADLLCSATKDPKAYSAMKSTICPVR